MKKLISLLLLLQASCCFCQQLPAFKPLRYEEDYSSLKNDSTGDWYKGMKYHSLSKSNHSYLSIGGDIRYQYLRFHNEGWGDALRDRDGYLLTRYLVHTDLHVSHWFRVFAELQSSLANGLEKKPSPVDENQLDLHQAFGELTLPLRAKESLIARIGRQELSYGSQRLVAVRDGPNNRQSFDAVKLVYAASSTRADVFISSYVHSRQLIFDDGFNKDTRFWGAYLVKNKLPLVRNIDLYYFGLWKRNAKFDDGSGRELRHSVGTRIWDNAGNWRYDIEGVYQFGSLGSKPINAWTSSFNVGYKFNHARLKPEIGLKTELISGDADYEDGQLQTFNPLFPRGGYFGLVSLIGPANLSDIHPSFALNLSRRLMLNVDYDIFWRYSKNDGIYGPNAAMIYSGKNSCHGFIGRQLAGDLAYTPNRFLYFRAELSWFDAGGGLKDVGAGKDILFTAFTVQVRF